MNKNVMFNISYGLYVLTAKENDKHNGCIINTLQQVTESPLRVAVTVNKANHTHDMILRTGEFNVSVISEKATFDMFKHFGFQSGRDVDKFAEYPKGISDNGLAYVIDGTNGFISGKVVSTVDLGSHTMFVAEVIDGEVLNEDPSATYTYYHKHIKEAPAQESKGWVCQICGYVHEEAELPEDFVCPWCKHGASDFKRK